MIHFTTEAMFYTSGECEYAMFLAMGSVVVYFSQFKAIVEESMK